MQNEKRVPHYSLVKIQKLIAENKYTITHLAQDNARLDFDLTPDEVVRFILTLNNTHFYKSMTSIYDYTVWHDVYHLDINKSIAYIKLQIISEESVIIQFKRK